ncbi:hypothetical protein A3A76_01720 [Candidatus Woesebacteria bacterium RIFCSPLOWO2_01_FULL_39_23]|uniref:SCP domain-containing protein n=1 Tax=Candidatus Woesebacteria bacterium RIFCSPHIGHO2_01_FULL_40_22 TaxID=1802499 RepID=A0A1F7YGR4_9BACT|nr:MAG: hypothetical protein A2141_02295 [Candidatus Woesebacteria bacterium RBG_16_40_11]OGM25798.1 MAG: hypothetical protein A2628_00575 [Candidatus Woesebacteria bacterium RIFCSPHIGHO2_01_FULL_40_22]OGM36380.1 MAG: hypothetical protein A3E41_04800 [Candidatus Woesebacteria bacterium RIFCSPHIGHO2_12_FULL_38_9]OGM61751.1 MAG: hypothetical protein A3A76_01720 [Candidatus Woesebacteria bacterium RIFCSPLOWO2_01_FULL_39_23]
MVDYASKLSHLFIPGYSNNHKAKVLHPESILVIIFLVIFSQYLIQTFPKSGVRVLGYAANISVDEIIRLTNQKRADAGVQSLSFSATLASAAKAKGEDMLAKDYWAHVAPDGTEPWKFFTDAGYKYRYAGENLARDFSSASTTVDAWNASPSHKENMLSGKYDEIGVAVVEGDFNGVDTTIVVQLFGKGYGDNIAQAIPTSSAVAGNANTVPTSMPTAFPTKVLPTLTPSSTPTPMVIIAKSGTPPTTPQKTLVSPFNTTKGVSIVTIVFLMAVFTIDIFTVSRRKIARVGGRAFAHMAFLGMILIIIIIARAGQIL